MTKCVYLAIKNVWKKLTSSIQLLYVGYFLGCKTHLWFGPLRENYQANGDQSCYNYYIYWKNTFLRTNLSIKSANFKLYCAFCSPAGAVSISNFRKLEKSNPVKTRYIWSLPKWFYIMTYSALVHICWYLVFFKHRRDTYLLTRHS